jgi:hypothetical protein
MRVVQKLGGAEVVTLYRSHPLVPNGPLVFVVLTTPPHGTETCAWADAAVSSANSANAIR